jgi:thiamine-phosphate pyrophosphorylase
VSEAASGALAGRSLYLCVPNRADLEHFVSECVAGGVDIVQLREKNLLDRDLLAVARRLRRLLSDLGVPFVMNDRPDLALEVGADGVHVGQDDAPPSLCRRILGGDGIVGLSTHALADLAGAEDEPVDYLAAGPVVPTPTKPGRPGTGLDYVRAAVATAAHFGATGRALPLFITGGVTPESIPGLAAAGVRGFVVVRYLTESDDPRVAAARLRVAIEQSRAALAS